MIYFILRQRFSHLEAFPLQWHFTVLKEVSACRRALNIWIHCTGLSGCSCSQTLVATVWTFIIVMSCRGSSEPPLKRESPVDDVCHILSLIITHTHKHRNIYIYVTHTPAHTSNHWFRVTLWPSLCFLCLKTTEFLEIKAKKKICIL